MRQTFSTTPEATALVTRIGGQRREASVRSDDLKPSSRPRRLGRNRQMRERRTAQLLVTFGIVLACVELYVILHVL